MTDPTDRPPEHGARLTLLRQAGDALGDGGGPPVRYAGEVVSQDCRWPIAVEVRRDASSADGLAAEAEAPTMPDAERSVWQVQAARMVRAAVRRAKKDGLAAPRRIQRWRPPAKG